MDDDVLVLREERRVNPPRRDIDRIMALEIHQMYAVKQIKDLGAQFQATNKESENRETMLWKRLDTIWGEMGATILAVQTQVGVIDHRSKIIQEYQQRRSGREWTLVLGIILAFSTVIITMLMGR